MICLMVIELRLKNEEEKIQRRILEGDEVCVVVVQIGKWAFFLRGKNWKGECAGATASLACRSTK